MKKLEIANNVTRVLGKTGLKVRKYSPEILVVVGVIGTVASAVMACKATTKIDDVLDDTKEQLDTIHKTVENPDMAEKYSEEDAKKDTTIVYAHAGVNFLKLYGPSVALGALSLSCMVASHNILRKRNIALAAAYATIDRGFKEYRSRVIERFGKELDRDLKYNVKAKEFEDIVTDDKGKEKTVKTMVSISDPNEYSDYARFFDDGCRGWSKDPEQNLMFLKQQQNFATDRLRSTGYLFLNDVYEMLGIPKTRAGFVVGWLYDEKNPVGDNFVDFGIYDVNKERVRDFVNGYERTILLDFNVDGNIIEMM